MWHQPDVAVFSLFVSPWRRAAANGELAAWAGLSGKTRSEASIFFSASKTLDALANHRRPYEFFERDISIRMGHCRRLE